MSPALLLSNRYYTAGRLERKSLVPNKKIKIILL
jgi:hypothetical protein